MQPLKPYNRMQMQLASNPVLSQPPLAAMQQLSEKPHLGFATKKTAWNPGPNVCNFTVTLGLQVAMVENGVRKTYRARYYNPATGRFVERDPLDGYINVPATLHKYLYASGNPVNRIDPSGKGDELIEEAELDERALTQSTRYAAKMLKLEHDALRAAIECLKQANTFAGNPDIWINVINGDVYLATEAGYELLDNLLFY
jgi:RHS repeat-associated protein